MSEIYETNKVNMHKSWENFFDEQIKNELSTIESKIGQYYTPNQENILKFTQTNLAKVNVIWIGLDPYDEVGVATGRSFEVGGLKNWHKNKHNASLRNILKLLYKTANDLEKSPKINKIYKEIKDKEFKIKKPNEIFNYWENQGVLFLNTAFTSEINESGSKKHNEAWLFFFEKLLEYIIKSNPEVIIFAWGNKVQKKVKKIISEYDVNVYYSSHPRNNKEDKNFCVNSHFLNSPCFKETNIIKWI